MNCFVYSGTHSAMIAHIEGVVIRCDKISDEAEQRARDLAKAYRERLPQIISFISDRCHDVFGYFPDEELETALGVPLIDLDNNTLIYPEQTLVAGHIFSIEFDGLFNKFFTLAIEG